MKSLRSRIVGFSLAAVTTSVLLFAPPASADSAQEVYVNGVKAGSASFSSSAKQFTIRDHVSSDGLRIKVTWYNTALVGGGQAGSCQTSSSLMTATCVVPKGITLKWKMFAINSAGNIVKATGEFEDRS
ncbi:hypothetical protein AB6V29_09230 [Microbacterium sp. 20-116]|uniref:hypothetical protein n=1 Tax=Microbacterium sp. 20-116 TaxID=3239883 RepID=UPI0034E1D4BE